MASQLPGGYDDPVRRMRPWGCMLGFMAIFVVALPEAVPAAGSAFPDGPDPSCSAVTKARPAKTRNIVYRVRCNFEVEGLSLSTNGRVFAVQRVPRIDRPTPGDRLKCHRGTRGLSRRSVACGGELGSGARVVGAFKVNGDPCKLRARFRASGGVDRDGDAPVPDIGYSVELRRPRARGC